MKKKKIISIVLILVLLIVFGSTIWYVSYGSTTEINLGTNVKGTLNSLNGELTITSTSSTPGTLMKLSSLSQKNNIKIINFANKVYLPADSSNFFQEFKNLTTIKNAANMDTSNVTLMSAMFWKCTSLSSIDLRGLDTSNVTSMRMMFEDCNSLLNANLENLNTSNVTSMYHMFDGCTVLTDINLKGLDTSNVTTMEYMFNECSSLRTLDISDLNTSSVTTMENMFNGCYLLTNLNLTNFSTSNVTTMRMMFKDCKALTNLDLSNFNTIKLTNMHSMFNNCISLASVNVSSFNTSNVTEMGFMFENCTSLKNIDLRSFNTSKVTTMETMFKNCTSLTSLDLSSFDMSKATTDYAFGDMLENCNALNEIYLPRYVKLLQLPAKYANLTDTTDKTVYNYISQKTFGVTTHLIKAFEITYECNAWYGTNTTFKQLKYLGTPIQLKGDEFGDSSNKMTLNSWNTNEDGTGTKYNVGATYSTDSDLTLYAQWQMQITFDNQNATTPGTQSIVVIRKSEMPQITVPTKTQYIFDGYYTQTNGNGIQYYTATGTSTRNCDFTENTTLYAKWTKNEFTVTFKNGGVTEKTQVVQKGQSATAPNLSRTGYTLSWDKSFTNVTSDLVVNAIWTKNEFTVTFKNGGVTEKTQVVQKGQSATAPNLTKAGYTLSWDKSFTNITSDLVVNAIWTPNTNISYKIVHHFRNLDTEVEGYTEEEERKTGTTGATVTAEYKTREGFTKNETHPNTKTSGIVTADGSLVLHLYYTRNTYNISYELNGGTPTSPLTSKYTYGKEMILQTNRVTKQGYEFAGWYDNEALIGNPVTSISATATGDKTFYAKWTKNIFTVTFKDGTERTDVQTINRGESATAPNWTKPGYTLTWDTNFENVTSDLTVNAQWTARTDTPYKVIHHFRNLDTEVEGYIDEEEQKTGTTDTEVTAEYKEREGFTKNEADTRTVKQGTVAGDGSLVLHLYYTRNTYDITYVLNGGTPSSSLTNKYTYGKEMILQTRVTKQGYTFAGWYDNEELSGNPVTSISATSTGNKTFYAKWVDIEQEYYILSESYSIDLVENTVTKVSPETAVADFLNRIETNGQKKVVNAQGQEITTTSLVGTGYKLQVTFKGETYTYEIAVRGDLDGNGKITTTDLSIINQQILNKIELKGIKKKAADTNYDGKLTTTDLSMINQAVLNKIVL